MSCLLRIRDAAAILPNGQCLAMPDLDLQPGDCLQVAGPSGAGKTSLMRAVAGLTPTCGEVTRGFQRLGYGFQEPRLVPGLSVMENLRLCCGRMADSDQLQEGLEAVRLAAIAGAEAASLSGGEAQRVNLLRALMLRPDLLLLDEVGSGLDDASWSSVSMLIKAQQARDGFALLQVSHMPQRLITPCRRVEMATAASRY